MCGFLFLGSRPFNQYISFYLVRSINCIWSSKTKAKKLLWTLQFNKKVYLIHKYTLFNTCWNSIYWSEVGVFFSSFRSVVIWFPWTTQACRDSWAQNCALLRDLAKSRYWIISLLPPFNTKSLSHKKVDLFCFLMQHSSKENGLVLSTFL